MGSLTPQTDDLWVVLHGALAIFEYEDRIEVRIPNLGTESAYRAGDWLAEGTLQPGETYRLVVPGASGAATFGSTENLTITGRSPSRVGASRLYATLSLPFRTRFTLFLSH